MSTSKTGLEIGVSDPETFVSLVVEQYQMAKGPSDRIRVDMLIRMAVLAKRISKKDAEIYESQKSSKFPI